MGLGMFWVNLWGCQNHPQKKKQVFLALTPWRRGHRPLIILVVREAAWFLPFCRGALAHAHRCASAREEKGGSELFASI